MISLLPFAFTAGVLTVAAPCLLPVLPGIVGGSLGQSKWRPLGIVVRLVTAFTIFGTAFAVFWDFLGLPKGTVRVGAIVLLFVFGVALAVPALYEWVVARSMLALRYIRRPSLRPVGGSASPYQPDGFWSAFGIGTTLGAVWTPCAGPIFGAILTVAASTQDVLQSGLLFFVYSLGAGVPMLLIGYGGRALALRIKGLAGASARIRQVAGVILAVWAVALWLGADRYLQAYLTVLIPESML